MKFGISSGTFALAIFLTFGITSANAQVELIENCASNEISNDLRIGACTALIRSGLLSRRDNALTFFNRGIGHHNEGEMDRAIADYSQSLNLNPNDADAYYNRGNAYRVNGELDKAIADYVQTLIINPNHINAYNNRANVYSEKGEVDKAIADYNQALSIDPEFAQAYNNRGMTYFDRDDLDRAIADYDKALNIDLNYTSAYFNRGNAYFKKYEFGKAIGDYDRALNLNPNFADAYNNRGNAYFNKGELDRAIADYDNALTIYPNNVIVYGNRGEAYAWLNRLGLARSDLDSSLSRTPEEEQANRSSSFCWELGLMGRATFARPYCERAVSTDTVASRHDRFAFILWQLGELDLARAELVKAYELSSKSDMFEPGKRLKEFPTVLVQGLLKRLTYRPGNASGKNNPLTKAAIKAFQLNHEMQETGLISDKLIAALKAARPK